MRRTDGEPAGKRRRGRQRAVVMHIEAIEQEDGGQGPAQEPVRTDQPEHEGHGQDEDPSALVVVATGAIEGLGDGVDRWTVEEAVRQIDDEAALVVVPQRQQEGHEAGEEECGEQQQFDAHQIRSARCRAQRLRQIGQIDPAEGHAHDAQADQHAGRGKRGGGHHPVAQGLDRQVVLAAGAHGLDPGPAQPVGAALVGALGVTAREPAHKELIADQEREAQGIQAPERGQSGKLGEQGIEG